ncbi:MAG: NAD(+)/NADH kinase [Thermotogota bacterium]|nr:NAD(+)/NADH kinase [Thermotogota bacterium]
MIKTAGFLYNPHKAGIKEKTESLKRVLIDHSIEPVFCVSTEDEYSSAFSKPDIMIVLGGDGSVLRSMPFSVNMDVPVAGINFGKFGFLTRYEYERVSENPNILMDSKISPRALLEITASEGDLQETHLALNDMVIQRQNLSQVEMYKIGVNDYSFEPKAADGIVVSTPTGSTAYALSLGGPIIFPECRSMQLNLIAPHTIANRSLVFNSQEKISVCLDNNDEMKYSVDGLPLEKTKKISVGISDMEFKLLYPESDEILQLVESKLLWGRRG